MVATISIVHLQAVYGETAHMFGLTEHHSRAALGSCLEGCRHEWPGSTTIVSGTRQESKKHVRHARERDGRDGRVRQRKLAADSHPGAPPKRGLVVRRHRDTRRAVPVNRLLPSLDRSTAPITFGHDPRQA